MYIYKHNAGLRDAQCHFWGKRIILMSFPMRCPTAWAGFELHTSQEVCLAVPYFWSMAFDTTAFWIPCLKEFCCYLATPAPYHCITSYCRGIGLYSHSPVIRYIFFYKLLALHCDSRISLLMSLLVRPNCRGRYIKVNSSLLSLDLQHKIELSCR